MAFTIKKIIRRIKIMKDITKIKSLSDTEFVDFVYQRTLGRKADEDGKKHFIYMLNSGLADRESVLLALLNCDEYLARLVCAEFVPAGHFYSAVPSVEDKQRYFSNKCDISPGALPGLNLNDDRQLDMMYKLKEFYDEQMFVEDKTDGARYYFNNPAYSLGDALTLQGMMRYMKPKRIVEVGSGFSSCVMLDINDRFF